MSNQDLNSSASKFISSLVKSLQIICNGHVDFSESIELIGHINVRIDHKLKLDYIVDEHVTKKGADCSTTFLSNSYHSSPSLQTLKDDSFERANSINMGGLPLPGMCPVPQGSKTAGFDIAFRDGSHNEDCAQSFAVNVESARERDIQESPMAFKLEGDGDSTNECMALSTPTDNFLSSKDGDGLEPLVSEPSGSMEVGVTTTSSRKRKSDDQGTEETNFACQVYRSTNAHRTKSRSSNFASTSTKIPSSHRSSSLDTTQSSFFGGKNGLATFQDPYLPSSCNYYTRYRCPECPYQSVDQEDMNHHIYKVHSEHGISSSPAKCILCSVCHASFKTQTGLKQHIEVKHSANPSLRCPICDKVMYNKINLEGHINSHKGLKPFSCSHCKKTFSYKQSLLAHEKVCWELMIAPK